MRYDFRNLKLTLLIAAMPYSCLAGCSGAFFAKAKNVTPYRVTSFTAATQHSLPVIEYKNRLSIELIQGYESFKGTITAVEPPTSVRDLSLNECRSLSFKSSPVARQLESHGRWLQRMNRSSPSVVKGVFLQAEHERSVHVANSLEAYLNLTEVYLQRSVVDEMVQVLNNSEEAIESFQKAGIEIPGDPNVIERRRMEIDEQISDLRMNQNKLTSGLEALLELSPQSDLPIWTSFKAPIHETIPSEEMAIQIALGSRDDLKALETVERGSYSMSSEEMKGLFGGTPFLGSSISIPGPAGCFQISLQKQIASLKRSENVEYQHQIHDSVIIKQNQIRQEVSEALQNLSNHYSRLSITQQKLISYQNSLEAESKAKDQRPVDLSLRTAKEIETLKAVSDLIHERIAIEIAHVRLEKSLGNAKKE